MEATTQRDDVRGPRERTERLTGGLRTVLLALVLAFFIRTGLAQAYLVEGPSMEPTIEHGERVLVVKFPFGLTLPAADEALFTWASPEAGDVVILASPIDGADLVKRVVGLPGDTIEIRGDAVLRNGAAMATGRHGPCASAAELECEWSQESAGAQAWLTWRSRLTAPDDHPAITVPPDHVYVLGDHRDRSNDSRYFGVVPVRRVRGKVLFH